MSDNQDPTVYSVADLPSIVPVGRATAYKVAREIGQRAGRRLVISRDALNRWLNENSDRLAQPSRSETQAPNTGKMTKRGARKGAP